MFWLSTLCLRLATSISRDSAVRRARTRFSMEFSDTAREGQERVEAGPCGTTAMCGYFAARDRSSAAK
eukprot:7126756-Pyramimonas_sp.AAC.1